MFRVGTGYDIHKLVEGRKLILGGVEIPYSKGLYGHSDADVLVHAICDALLGAAALGDIGQHFPDNSTDYKDVNSLKLLSKVVMLVHEKGFKLINVDSTIIAEAPKLAKYIDQIRKNLSEVLMIPVDLISVKAKTNEKLDAIGKGEAIACQTIASLSVE